MVIGVLTLRFLFHGCYSLKDKRQRIRGFKDRFGGNKNLAVCESGDHDRHDSAEISVVSISNEARIIESELTRIVDFCRVNIDGELLDNHIEWL